MKRLKAIILKKGPLTEKESCVLRYLCEGYYRPEIAIHLHRTLSTISKHIENIAQKLDAHGSTEIVKIAEEMGLVKIKLIEHRYQKLVLILLTLSQVISPNIGRRPPNSPRPTTQLIRRTQS